MKPEVISYSAAISECEKGAEWVLPFKLLNEMRQWNLTPEVLSCSAAITAREKGVEWLQPFELFKEIRQSDLKPEHGIVQHRHQGV